jgi:hypothetical protein
MTNESTTVVNQFTNSYKYMLGASSRVFGVQLYSESSKKSSSFDVMIPVIRSRARESVADKEVAAVRRIIPPRCAELKRVGVSLYR